MHYKFINGMIVSDTKRIKISANNDSPVKNDMIGI